MPKPDRGLYEVLITEALDAELRGLGDRLDAVREGLDAAEAADRVALHVSRIVQRAIAAVGDEKIRVAVSIALARDLIERIHASITAHNHAFDATPDLPIDPGTLLRAVLGHLPDGTPETIDPPLTPLLDTALLTNAPGEPRVGSQVLAEIPSADRIDVVMAFIRRSGIAPLLDALRRHCEHGRPVRVLTTTYTGTTEAHALDALHAAGARVRVSYDTTTTRLHAKAWLFHRGSGFSTAYIGSSNLTHAAQVTGLEWNVRVSGARNPHVVEKVGAVFESYWNSGDFVDYDRAEFDRRTEAAPASSATVMLSPVELRPEPFQARLLEQIALARQRGHHRNLLVSATGTGKTVMAALDYAGLARSLPRARLLFVAHRAEILEQSLATFRHALRNHAFGELWVGGHRPRRFEHVFASIQSLRATGLADLDPAHFDVVVVDEFHHAAAPSYRALLDHVRPAELLGLTATPERSDGLPVLEWFDHRIAAELRLWDAIDQHRLTPFAYFGVHDGQDLRTVPWQHGRGYDVDALSNLLTADEAWARLVLEKTRERVDDVQAMRALGFCVSVAHARFMARGFQAAGVAATAVWADSPEPERKAAIEELAAGRVNVVFSVDLFNEGIDVPEVDTLLMLRPTDSPTLFLQQLGRGLRLSPGKSVCTVLDFVGHHRKEFRFDRRFGALLGGSRRHLADQVRGGFPFLPAGCHMALDPVASDIVLRNIRDAVPSQWKAKVAELRLLADEDPSIGLAGYLDAAGLDLGDIYGGGRTWSDLRADAGLAPAPSGPADSLDAVRHACGRLVHVDDTVRIDAYRRFLSTASPPDPARLTVRDRRLLRMLIASLADQVVSKSTSLEQGGAILWAHHWLRDELRALLDVLAARVAHVTLGLDAAGARLDDLSAVPLQVHARYTRIEILAAFDVGSGAKVAPWQTGVYWVPAARADLLAFTLDKSSGHFSPTTRYRDYAISRDLIHWESQSTTRADSETGLRYQQHARQGSHVMLFARPNTAERAFMFLGPADYVGHVAEQPMGITWRLWQPLPGDVFAAFAAAVA